MIKYLSPFKAQKLGAAKTQLYVVPTKTTAQLRALTLHNTSIDAVEVEIYLLSESEATASDAQRLIKKTLSQNESYLCPEVINHILTPGMKVVAAGENANAMLSIVEQTI